VGEPLRRLQNAVVDDLVQQVVLERVLAGVVERRGVAAHDEPLSQQHRQHLERGAVDRCERAVPEHVPDHGGLLQSPALARRQRIDARLQHAGQGRRYMRFEQLVGQHAPPVGLDADDAVVDQHLDQFFHVERVAFGAGGQQRAQRRRDLGQALQQDLGQFLTERLVERLQLEHRMAHVAELPLGLRVGRRGARHQHAEQRRIAVGHQQMAHEVERAGVGPVQIVQHHHHRPAFAETAEAERARFEGPRLELRFVAEDLLDMRTRREVEADEVAEQVDRRLAFLGEQRRQPVEQLAVRHLGRVGLGDLELARQHVAQQAVRMDRAARDARGRAAASRCAGSAHPGTPRAGGSCRGPPRRRHGRRGPGAGRSPRRTTRTGLRARPRGRPSASACPRCRGSARETRAAWRGRRGRCAAAVSTPLTVIGACSVTSNRPRTWR
jgi:hypothetical protein